MTLVFSNNATQNQNFWYTPNISAVIETETISQGMNRLHPLTTWQKWEVPHLLL